MPPELLIPGLLTFLSLIHEVDEIGGLPATPLVSQQILADYQIKAWGGIAGQTIRDNADHAQLEGAILHWAQALVESPPLLRPHEGR